MDIILEGKQIDKITNLLDRILREGGASYCILTDLAGNLICKRGSNPLDATTLAVLSAANFAATKEIAFLMGEEDFSLLFHRGQKENVHFTKINPEIILIVLFKPDISLGLLRLKVDSIKEEIQRLLEQ